MNPSSFDPEKSLNPRSPGSTAVEERAVAPFSIEAVTKPALEQHFPTRIAHVVTRLASEVEHAAQSIQGIFPNVPLAECRALVLDERRFAAQETETLLAISALRSLHSGEIAL